MKKAFLFALLLLMLPSCSEMIDDKEVIHSSCSITKSIMDNSSETTSLSDVHDYLVYRMKVSNKDIKDIYSYSLDDEARIHVVNMKNGHWYVFSGNKNTTPILTEGDEGGLYLNKGLDNHCKAWLNSLRTIIRDTDPQDDQSRKHQLEWIRVKRMAAMATKEILRDNDTQDLIYDYVVDTLIYSDIQGLTETSWDQGSPWNHNIPKMRYGGGRCKVGCTVIAIAQLLYYTHYEFGYPTTIYANATCDDYYDEGPSYDFVFSNPTSTSWDLMSLAYDPLTFNDPYMPALCALVASASSTKYRVTFPMAYLIDDSYGSTNPAFIPLTLMVFGLFDADSTAYQKTTIMNEIYNSRPVICYGIESATASSGHTFLIDGYKRVYTKTTETISDTEGHILEVNYYYDEFFNWRINTGNAQPSHHIMCDENAYYSYYRKIIIGWE